MGNFDVTICDIKNREKRRTKKHPYAFTEQWLAMLSEILNDKLQIDQILYIFELGRKIGKEDDQGFKLISVESWLQ